MKLIYSHKGRYSQLYKHPDKGTHVSSSAGEELPTSWYNSTDKDSLVNLPANYSTAVNQSFVGTVNLINSKHFDGLMNFCLYQTFVKYLIFSSIFSNTLSVSTFLFHEHAQCLPTRLPLLQITFQQIIIFNLL